MSVYHRVGILQIVILYCYTYCYTVRSHIFRAEQLLLNVCLGEDNQLNTTLNVYTDQLKPLRSEAIECPNGLCRPGCLEHA